MVKLGLWEDGIPHNNAKLLKLEREIGKKFEYVVWVQAWGDAANCNFLPAHVSAFLAGNQIPIIYWEPYTPGRGIDQPEYRLRSIANGHHDTYIRHWAASAKNVAGDFYIAFAPDANATLYPWGVSVNTNSVKEYERAFYHVVNIFRREGARNVKWLWIMRELASSAIPFSEVYPGSKYVDAIGIDGVNNGIPRWMTFDNLFSETYLRLIGLNKMAPIFVTETATHSSPRNKVNWLKNAFDKDRLNLAYPRIRAICYNNTLGGEYRIDSSPESLEAYIEIAKRTRS